MLHVYGIDETGERWAAIARQLVDEVVGPLAADIDREGRFPAEAIECLSEHGLMGLCLPLEFGGKGQPPRVFAAVVEELAHACSSTAMIYVMHVSAAQAIVASTTFSRRTQLLREIASGMHLTTLAFSESGSRSQFWAPVSKLVQEGDGCVTSARKSWVTSAHHANSYVASGQRPGASSPAESTIYLVERQAPGVIVASEFDGLGLRGNDSAPVQFECVRVPDTDQLTKQGAGADMMLGVVLPWFVVGTAAMANGLCLAAIDSTARHLSSSGFEHTRTQLRDLPNLRARLAEMSIRTEQSRSLLGCTVAAMEANDPQAPLLVLQSRAAAISAAVDVTDLAMKACGGAAFSKQLPIERLFRDARAGWVMAPTVDHLLDFVGRCLTGIPLFDGME